MVESGISFLDHCLPLQRDVGFRVQQHRRRERILHTSFGIIMDHIQEDENKERMECGASQSALAFGQNEFQKCDSWCNSP